MFGQTSHPLAGKALSLLWQKEQPFGAEFAEVTIEGSRLHGRGTSVGHPPPYVLTYELHTGEDFVTSHLKVAAQGLGWSRRLELTRRGDGLWSITAENEGDVDLPPPGGDSAAVNGALDCDLGLCPLTNTMPVLRHNLHRGGGPIDFLMAWVAVPELTVHPSEQRYTFVGMKDENSIVRYEGKHREFVGDLTFDPDGLVIHYPDLATRVATGS